MVRYGTLRSDFLPPARKVSDINSKSKSTVRGRLRSSRIFGASSTINARVARSRVRKPLTVDRRIKVTVPNVRSRGRGRGRRGRTTGEPVYQFRKYLEAMKGASTDTMTVTKQSMPKPDKQSGLSRVVARSTQTSTTQPSQAADDEEIHMEDDSASIEDELERRVKLIKTAVSVSPKTSMPQAKSNAINRSKNTSRMVKGHRANDDDRTPSARLFWKSFS